MPEEPYVFVSYASADRERVLPVVDQLQGAGVRVWIDREGIHGGANYGVEITAAIEHAAMLVLMCSPASLASRNVRQELALGWRFEKLYLPLLLDRVEIPREVAYWLEGSQWIELLDRPESQWLASVATALEPLGIAVRLPSAGSPLAASPRERPLLIGREREQGILRQQLDRLLAGRGGSVLISGEAGIGKTTLAEDLCGQAEEAGALVFWGHAYDLSVTPPYGPWLEIFRQYGASAGDLPPVPAFVGDAEELARVGSQETLFAAAADFLIAVAAQRPLVLVLDDLHWADQASLDFFRFLARQISACRLLLLATYRGDELHRRHPLAALLPLLVREADAQRLEVRPLDETGHRALIQRRYVLAEADQTRLEQYLNEHAEGNPLYAGELLRTLEEESVLTRQADGWVLGDLDQAGVPTLLRQVIEGRVGRLDEESQRLLRVAAVIGQSVLLEVWATVGEVEEDALFDLAERAEEATLLRGTPAGDGVQFGHALIREALYEGIPSLRRRRLHRQAGEALAKQVAPDPTAVAYHFQRADDPRAIDWSIRSGERAVDIYAPSVAIGHFDLAEKLASHHGQTLPATMFRARGQQHRLVGDFEAARRDFETVLTLARESGDARAEWQALIDLGMLWASRDYTQTNTYFQQAVEVARKLNASDVIAHSLNRIGNWYLNIDQPQDALRHHHEALAIFEQLDDRAGIAATSDFLGLASYISGDLIQGTVHYRRAIELFRAADNREALATILTLMSMRGGNYMTCTMVADQAPLTTCARDCEEAAAFARTIGHRAGEAFALGGLARSLGSAGFYQRAFDVARRSIEIAEEIGHRQWVASGHCAIGSLFLDCLAFPEAEEHLSQAVALSSETGSRHWIFCTRGLLASALIARGNLDGAEAVLDVILAADTSMQTMGQRLAWSARVELELARGNADAALDLLDRMLAASPNASDTQPVLSYSVLRAAALIALDRLDDAEPALHASLRTANDHEARPWLWRIHRTLGTLAQRRGDADRATAEFAAARTTVEELAAEIPDVELRQSFLKQKDSLLLTH